MCDREEWLAGMMCRFLEAARASLKFLSVIVDVDKLYNVALGTYDFDLVIMVAQVGRD
jgi:hypothetical protein